MKNNWIKVVQPDGPTLGYSPLSDCRIIERDGKKFKSFDGSDRLLPYEDWRLPYEERAADLASRLSVEQIAGLMLYSPQNFLPMKNDTYGGRRFDSASDEPWSLSDSQRRVLAEDNVRHMLVAGVESPVTAALWNNEVQAFAERLMFGVPANNSSDPRHSAFFDAQFASGGKGSVSMWSNSLGLAATFDPATVRRFGEIASAEYRSMGLATALSPQADLGTDPRWYRFSATFGNDPALVADLTRAYVDGFQSSPDSPGGGWGRGSVNAMVKHWPGGGCGEGGRDAHYGNGKYAVYPGGCYETHKIPFTQGAFALDGATQRASAVMPYYTVSYGQTDENVGNSFNRSVITGQLRGDAGYDGVVCTDWAITHDEVAPGVHSGKPWGVESLTEAERHYKALMAGVDQFGGNNDKKPVLEAYAAGVAEHGEEFMRGRFELSARRLLLNMFRTGLFENPYVDVEETSRLAGCAEFRAEGYDQQLRSVVMLKNHDGTLPLGRGTKVWIPQRHIPDTLTYWRTTVPGRDYFPVTAEMLPDGLEYARCADDADCAVVFVESPKSYLMGYDGTDAANGGNGYIPISLQYRPYTATAAREHSIAGGDPFESTAERSYRGKTARTINECDLDMLAEVRRAMGDRPVVLVVMATNPPVMSELEPLADAILTGFDVSARAYVDIISGCHEPSALLPFEMPASMDDVERHCEDRPHDIRPYTDADGNSYGFGFGLDWSGPISDSRTRKYAVSKA